MTDHGYIGLNEVALGISVPKYWGHLMERTVGSGRAEKLLQNATLLSPSKALEIGMIDDVCSKDDLEDMVHKRMGSMIRLPSRGRAVRGCFDFVFYVWMCALKTRHGDSDSDDDDVNNHNNNDKPLPCLIHCRKQSFYSDSNLSQHGWHILKKKQPLHGICFPPQRLLHPLAMSLTN